MYQASKFNIYKQVGNEYIVFNTYTGECRLINKDEYELLITHSNKSEVNSQRYLFDCGFLVDNKVDEYQEVNRLRNKYVTNPSALSLYILPTEQCNFRCTYCYEKFPNLKMEKSIQDGIIKFVKRNISKYKILRVEWFGGEPLLALDVIEYISEALLEICRKNRVTYYASMTTNAYLLDLNSFNRLRRCHILSYQITVDGIRQAHDQQRVLAGGGGTYDRIMYNLTQIQQNVRTISLDVTIRVNISRYVYEHIFEFADEFKKLFKGDGRFRICFKIVRDYGGDAIKSFSNEICNNIDLTKIQNYCEMNEIPYDGNAAPCIGYSVCYASKNNTWVIGALGNLMKCTIMLYDDRNQIGWVLEDGSLQIDAEKHSKWIASCEQYTGKAKDCKYSPICLKSFCFKHYLEDKSIGCEIVSECVDNYINQYFEKNRSDYCE